MRLFHSSILITLLALGQWTSADTLPRFQPQLLLFEASAENTRSKEIERYYAMGQSALDAPIQLTPQQQAPASALEEAGLFDFIAYISSRYKGMQNADEVLEFTHVGDPELLKSVLNDPQKRERLLTIYNELDHMDYLVGWYESPQVYCATVRINQTDGGSYVVTMPFIFTDEGWKALSAKMGFSPLSYATAFATMRGELKDGLRVTPAPQEALSQLNPAEARTIRAAN